MNLFKRAPTPAPPPITWADAPLYAQNSYSCVAVELSRLAEGHETPGASPGDWARHGHGPIHENQTDTYGVGILCGRLPHGNGVASECESTWVAALRVDIHTDGKLVRDIERLIASRLRWADGITTTHAPVRLTPNSKAVLLPFRVEAHDPRTIYSTTRWFTAPADKASDFRGNRVSIESFGVCFAVTGFAWRDGVDLRAVHRDALPVVSSDEAREMIAQCSALIEDRLP